MREAPTLTTDRLVLRPMRLDDFDAYEAMMASLRARFMGGPFDRRGAWGTFCHDAALWQFFGHGALMMELKATGECVGQVGINHGPLFPEKELGWLLYDGHEGRGFATEAASAMLGWAKEQPGIHTLVSYFDPANTRSIAIAQRLGATLDPDAPREDDGDIVYRYRLH